MKLWTGRFNWGELTLGLQGPALELAGHEPGNTLIVGFILGTLYLKLPEIIETDLENAYGFTTSDYGAHFHWGRKPSGAPRMCIWDWPWTFGSAVKQWEWVAGQGYVPIERKKGVELHEPIATKWSAPYSYVRKNGEVQIATATFYRDKMEWRRKWLKAVPLFNLVRECINVEFNREMGEGVGTWKGGVLGCGYEMKTGEAPLDTLRRMERERTFSR